ncbi:hypothetical protein MMC10_002495 [Thelotrema lepadinum]|nr:hypothetical protein [Thelotrema lepadinum]
MAYYLYSTLQFAPEDMQASILKSHWVDRTSHFMKSPTGPEYTERVIDEYRMFLKRIYKVLDIDLTECNMLNAWFFDPDDIKHVSSTVVRALFEIISNNNLQRVHGKAVMMEIKRRFEAEVALAEANDRPPPAKVRAQLLIGINRDVKSGRLRLRLNMRPGVRAARMGLPFTTNKWIDLPY